VGSRQACLNGSVRPTVALLHSRGCGRRPMSVKLPEPPQDCISRVRFAPFQGSRHLLVSSWDENLRLYDAASESLIGLQKHSLAILDCAFLQDPVHAVSAGLEGRLSFYDFQVQQELQLGSERHAEAIRCLEFHPPTQQVFTGSWDATLRAWDPRQPAIPTQVIPLGTKCFALDAAMDRVVVGGADRHIHIFDVRRLGMALERRESSPKHQIRSLKIGIDQRAFASSSVEGRVALEYFDEERNRRGRYAFKCHREKESNGEETVHPVNALAFHPVHGTFATGGSDGGVCIWDGFARKRLWRLQPFDTAVSSLCFSSDGSHLAIGVSYTFDDGEKIPPPATKIVIRQIAESDVLPKGET